MRSTNVPPVFLEWPLASVIEGVVGRIEENHCEQISCGTDGDVYVLSTNRGRFILRLWANRELASVRNEQLILESLRDSGVEGVQEPYLLVNEHPSGGVAAIRRYIKGHAAEHITRSGVERLGRLLADLHQLPVPSEFEQRCHPWPRVPDGTFLDALAHNLREFSPFCSEVKRRLRDQGVADLPVSLVHDDISLDNLIATADSSIILIDWSDAHVDTSVSDIVVASSQLNLNYDQRDALIGAYEEIRSLSKDERNVWPLLEARRHLFILHYLQARGLPVSAQRMECARVRCKRLLEANS